MAGLGELYFVSIWSLAQGGGGIRANNVKFDTSLDGKRETLRSPLRNYMGTTAGSTTRKFNIVDHMDFQFLANGLDLELAFANSEILDYQIQRYSDGAAASGQCHITTGPKVTTADGAITEFSADFEGDPALFQ
jgi:hypothetical protein